MPVKILIAEDEERVRKVLKYLLEDEGFEVKLAENAEIAFRMLSTEDFDVVIMDINMPGINGIEGIRSIKIIKEDQRIIVLTGYCMETMKENSIKAGADECLFKPHGIKELPDAIKRVIKKD